MLLACIIITVIIIGIKNIVLDNKKGLSINNVKILEKIKGEKIGVYIDGEVKNPGYVKIPKGENLGYAINALGGITKEADIQSINLKMTLKNQEKVIVPKIKDKDFEENEMESDKKIDINKATKDELTRLDGIGEKTAENIIKYRESNGFIVIEDIMNVKGIGKGKFNKIKEHITIQ